MAACIAHGSSTLHASSCRSSDSFLRSVSSVKSVAPSSLSLRFQRRGLNKRGRGGFSFEIVASSSTSDDAMTETSDRILSSDWPEGFSMLNFEDLTSYLEPMIFKADAQPSALLGDVMSSLMYAAKADQLLEEINPYFEKVSGLPVIDKDHKCIGVISKKDKQKASKGLKSTVGEVMSSPPVTMTPEKTVLEAAATMLKSKIHRIPIVNKESEVVGVVTRTDIFVALEGLPTQ